MTRPSMDELRDASSTTKRTRRKKPTALEAAVINHFHESTMARWDNLTPQWQRYLKSFAWAIIKDADNLRRML